MRSALMLATSIIADISDNSDECVADRCNRFDSTPGPGCVGCAPVRRRRLAADRLDRELDDGGVDDSV